MGNFEKALDKARRHRNAHAVGGSLFQSSGGLTNLLQGPASAKAVSIAESQLERNRILAHRQKSPEADVFRILRTQVLQIMNKSGFRTLAITSPRYGEGKTTIAMNLAVSIALDLKQTVLLVDLDLRKPAIGAYMDIASAKGLTDYLVDNVPISQCLLRPPFERMRIFLAGRSLENSSELLGSPKMVALAQELKNRYQDRFVIYDMPPVLAQDDPIAFLPHVDATLVIVRDGVTQEDDLKICLERLSNTNIIGTVLNNSMQS